MPNLNAKGEDGNDKLEHESKSELPECSVDPGPCLGNRNCMVRICEVPVDIVADVHLVRHPALREEQVDQLTGVHPGVLVGVGNDCSHSCHCKNLSYRVPAQPETTLMSLTKIKLLKITLWLFGVCTSRYWP